MHSRDEERERTAGFRRNTQLEHLLSELNEVLRCAEERVIKDPPASEADHPVVFVMGPLRSGTTLFMQWMANTRIVSYPTNLLSRFYGAPLIGARIQMLLTDPSFNFRNEILDFNSPVTYVSENGKTSGALAPNEFWYFWRRYLPFRDLDWLPDEELMRVVDRDNLVAELKGLTRVFDKPFALKGMILNYNIPFLNAIFKKALFIHIRREPVATVASILEARRRQLGSENEWYSFKIPEYPRLKEIDPVAQSAGQWFYINKAVSAGMEQLPEERKLVVDYEDFCAEPRKVFSLLINKLGLNANTPYNGPDCFHKTRAADASIASNIRNALSQFKDSP